MEIIRAQVLGFCFGVKRAVSEAQKALLESNRKIYSLGPIIHNPEVLADFNKKGLNVLDDSCMDHIESDSTVIVRAHGTTPDIIEFLQKKGVQILDATCPKVHASQILAQKWTSKGSQVYIAGDRNHGEVTGITGYTGGSAIVIENTKEALQCEVKPSSILLAQTTFNPVIFEEIAQILKVKNNNIQIFNTICNATLERQNALKALEGKCDGIIVIGGKNSANTRRLYETACRICNKAILIENQSQIEQEFYSFNRVAITAGASTPDNVIDDVEQNLIKNACY